MIERLDDQDDRSPQAALITGLGTGPMAASRLKLAMVIGLQSFGLECPGGPGGGAT